MARRELMHPGGEREQDAPTHSHLAKAAAGRARVANGTTPQGTRSDRPQCSSLATRLGYFCRVSSPKKAWETAVLKAHGHTPRWTKRSNCLAPESQAAYAKIDLRFHDLRHEAGSRWLEAGMPLHHVKELLGHANIATTDTYLNAGRVHLRESMERAELRKSGAKVVQTVARDGGSGGNGGADTEAKSLIN